jgi:hypothetical protein
VEQTRLLANSAVAFVDPAAVNCWRWLRWEGHVDGILNGFAVAGAKEAVFFGLFGVLGGSGVRTAGSS